MNPSKLRLHAIRFSAGLTATQETRDLLVEASKALEEARDLARAVRTVLIDHEKNEWGFVKLGPEACKKLLEASDRILEEEAEDEGEPEDQKPMPEEWLDSEGGWHSFHRPKARRPE